MAITKDRNISINWEELRKTVLRDIQEFYQMLRDEREKLGLQEQREEKPRWLM